MEKSMKVLMFSTDKQILDEKSEARKRIGNYGPLFEELHIIVFATRKSQITNPMLIGRQDKSQINFKLQISENVFTYPTNTRFRILYFWDAYKIGKNIIRNWELEIRNCAISAQDPFETGLVGWCLKKKFNLSLQLQIHADIFSPYFYSESFKNKLRVWLAKFLLPRADGIRVVSERIKQSLLALYPKPHTLRPISVLPILVDVKKIQTAKIKIDLRQKYSDRDFIILMASRLTQEKNIGLGIEAMREVAEKYPKSLLVIVGNGPKHEALKLQITNYKLQNNIILEPWTDDLASYYKTADIFLLTSNYEGYGRTIVEAMAAGLPVVMTDVGLAGELLIDDLDGWVVPVGDERALAKAILESKENSFKREEFKQNALRLLQNWPKQEEYWKQYRDCLESAGAVKMVK
ncbi:MAG: glycosyltransferase family 4 protein [bacterium]|nr:glycosyltransferase family 4 protein [bacterium]